MRQLPLIACCLVLAALSAVPHLLSEATLTRTGTGDWILVAAILIILALNRCSR